MFTQKLIVRLIAVKGVDDPVTVFDGLTDRVIGTITRRVRVARDIQPVAAPALAVSFGIEQSIDDFVESIRLTVVKKCVDFLGGGRQAGEVKRGAPNQCSLVCPWYRSQFFRVESGANETVDSCLAPVVNGL